MMPLKENEETNEAKREVEETLARLLGVANVETFSDVVGNKEFLKFRVGRTSQTYDSVLRQANKNLPEANPYKGLVSLHLTEPPAKFSLSLEAEILKGILARSTRNMGSSSSPNALIQQYVPFRNGEESLIIQPATHLIVGRRGVGKSTLILKAQEMLGKTSNLSLVLDMQAYAHRQDQAVLIDIFADLATSLGRSIVARESNQIALAGEFDLFSADLLAGRLELGRASAALRRLVSKLTSVIHADVFVFLDDFHLIDIDQQPTILDAVHGALKGARGWLKVSGLRSLLRAYDPSAGKGLQTPGDAQIISLDLTLADPEAAEEHLKSILVKFLSLVGVKKLVEAIAPAAFQRLVWANAGVPRDFLQMFARSLEHAERSGRGRIELTDANLAIGDFGQPKMNDLDQDAQNEESTIKRALDSIEKQCLEKKKTNAFLIRSESTPGYKAVQTLSDLRLLHLLHQTITPHKAGERFEAYMLDYSLFTGFRRRPGVKQVMPGDGKQFKAAELRKIPILPANYLGKSA